MPVRIVRLGSPRNPGEGPRIGTVRRPPRGVPKRDFARLDSYDIWLPTLAPSEALRKAALSAETAPEWNRFVTRYRAEMHRPDPSRLLDLLAALSPGSDFSLGCYCEDERRCHRSVLRQLLKERKAVLEPA